MKCRLSKIQQLSGDEASVYSVHIDDEEITLFDRFIDENKNSYKDELKDIVSRLNTIGHKTGAREQYFKLKEGKPGDGICALYDDPDSNLRLYCIRFGSLIVVVGGGGYKPKNIRSFQENEKLTEENYLLQKISKELTERIKGGDIEYSDDYMDFDGDLEFNFNEDD